MNYHFRIDLQSLPVPQTPKVLWLCFFFLYVNVQGVEGIQKGAWGERGVPSWVPGLGAQAPFPEGVWWLPSHAWGLQAGQAHLPRAER